MAGPAESIEPPLAFTPFTVSKSMVVRKSHRISPVAVEYARKCPSIEPENTTPGIAETAADCAALQPLVNGTQLGFGAGVFHTSSPVASFSAYRPGAASGGRATTSETATYIRSLSAAEPHSTPPSALPF